MTADGLGVSEEIGIGMIPSSGLSNWVDGCAVPLAEMDTDRQRNRCRLGVEGRRLFSSQRVGHSQKIAEPSCQGGSSRVQAEIV